MSDIERRLRKWAERWPAETNTATLVIEAAGRIAELEDALGALLEVHGNIEYDSYTHDRAVATLIRTTKKD